ncbi:hypothetical protein N9515_07835 [Vicingaceae bacterium]|nr:hypothetical protein [Vicingaceae bacterium]MDB4061831.1 hypothetical protein [Vicingaceae bacterium]
MKQFVLSFLLAVTLFPLGKQQHIVLFPTVMPSGTFTFKQIALQTALVMNIVPSLILEIR